MAARPYAAMAHVIVASPHELHWPLDRLRHQRRLYCWLVIDPPAEKPAPPDHMQGPLIGAQPYGIGDGGLSAGRRFRRHPDLCRPGPDIGHRTADLHRRVIDERELEGGVHPFIEWK